MARTEPRTGHRRGTPSRASVIGLCAAMSLSVAVPAGDPPPSNDTAPGAATITQLPFTTTAVLGSATVDPDDSTFETCEGTTTASVWFRYQAVDGWAPKAAASGPVPADVRLARGEPGSMALVACRLDVPEGPEALVLEAGTYYVSLSTSAENVPPWSEVQMTLFDARCEGVTTHDYNGDGCPDLAVGLPAAAVLGLRGAGTVEVAYGNSYRDFSAGHRLLTADGDLGSDPQAGAAFGAALATGFLNDDHFADLAIGIPGADSFGRTDSGAVLVLFGGVTGLGTSGSVYLEQGLVRGSGGLESGDRFGWSLDIGDHRLLVGAPGEDIGAIADAGAVLRFSNFVGDGDKPEAQFLSQSGSVAGMPEAGDHFGRAVAMGAGSTVIVGAPTEDVGTTRDAGAVVTIDPSGVSRYFSQDSAGMPGVAEPGDRFGAALAPIADPNDDGVRVAIGVPGEDLGTVRDAGSVNFLHAATPTVPTRPQRWDLNQATPGVPGVPEPGDHFGAVFAKQFDNHELLLVVGVPDEDLGNVTDAGMVVRMLLPPVPTGSTTLTGQAFTQASSGVAGSPESGDRFGAAVTTMGSDPSFEDNGVEAIYVGVPGEDYSSRTDIGWVQGTYASHVTVLPSRPGAGSRFGLILSRQG